MSEKPSYVPEPISLGDEEQQLTRITVVEHIYCQMPDREPSYYPKTFSRLAQGVEEPYARILRKVGRDWQALDFGWLKDEGVGKFCLENCGGPKLRHKQANSLKALDALLKVQIKFQNAPDNQVWECPVGETTWFNPGFDPAKQGVLIRCFKGTTTCVLTALPK